MEIWSAISKVARRNQVDEGEAEALGVKKVEWEGAKPLSLLTEMAFRTRRFLVAPDCTENEMQKENLKREGPERFWGEKGNSWKGMWACIFQSLS